MEKVQVLTRGRWIQSFFALVVLLSSGCASKILEYDNSDEITSNEEYDKKIKVKEIPVEPALVEGATAVSAVPSEAKVKAPAPVSQIKAAGKPQVQKTKPTPSVTTVKPMKKEPSLEDSEGFVGRRPAIDPFRVNEKVTLGLSYFNMTAGYMDLMVLPFAEVNGAKSYTFKVAARSTSIFSRFYAVDDFAITYMNFETFLPYNFQISVKESKQIADIRSFFDWKKLKGNYWEKGVSKDKGERHKEFEWDILPYSQNVISAIYYLRAHTLSPGKKLAFRVAHKGNNIVFTGEVLRREKLDTELGEMNTIVVKPQFEVDGIFKPVGDILIWLTDDDRKFVVRLESKIKIGTIVGKLKSIEPGIEVQ